MVEIDSIVVYFSHRLTSNRFYNTTYTLFAVSITLIYTVYEATAAEKPGLFQWVDMAISILDTMEKCVVAKKAATLIRRAVERARDGPKMNDVVLDQRPMEGIVYDPSRAFSDWWGPLNLVDGDLESSFFFDLGGLEGGLDIPDQNFNSGGHER